MTLIAAQISPDTIEILADGLSCHDNLTIVPKVRIGDREVSAFVPGRTTLQKVFPHSRLPIAIAHCGSNQRNGVPVRTIVEHFWHDAGDITAEQMRRRFMTEFGSGAGEATLWFVGFAAAGALILEVIGNDYERIDNERFWSGSGRDGLSPRWSDLDSLHEHAEQFLAECQRLVPFKLPFFANCFGGHWHRL